MNRPELLTNLVVGGIGAVGQALLLAHSLDSYPFKILMSPPGQFYSSTGFVLAFVSPPVSLLAFYLFRSAMRPFVTAIPVVVCPILFWSLFRVVFAVSGYQYAAPSMQSDIIATKSVEDGFGTLAAWLTFNGFLVGLLCGFVLWLLFRSVPSSKVA